MSTRIFVGGLPFSSSEDQLSDLFARYGTVNSAKVITDKITGRSRGFGFVEMSSSDEAAQAIAALNGYSLDSRQLTVNEAKPMERRESSGGNSRW